MVVAKVRIERDQRVGSSDAIRWNSVMVPLACASDGSVNSISSKHQRLHDKMADHVSYLRTDPLGDDSGAPLDDTKRDANARRLVDYMRKLKAQQVPQQVQGKPLVEVSCYLLFLSDHD